MNAVHDQPSPVAANDVDRRVQASPIKAVPMLWVLVGLGEDLGGAHLEPPSIGASPPRKFEMPSKPRELYFSAGKVKGPQLVKIPGDTQEPAVQLVRHNVF